MTFTVGGVRRLRLEAGSGCRWPGQESAAPGPVAHTLACSFPEAPSSGVMGPGARSWGEEAQAGAGLSHDLGVRTVGLWASALAPRSYARSGLPGLPGSTCGLLPAPSGRLLCRLPHSCPSLTGENISIWKHTVGCVSKNCLFHEEAASSEREKWGVSYSTRSAFAFPGVRFLPAPEE